MERTLGTQYALNQGIIFRTFILDNTNVVQTGELILVGYVTNVDGTSKWPIAQP